MSKGIGQVIVIGDTLDEKWPLAIVFECLRMCGRRPTGSLCSNTHDAYCNEYQFAISALS